MHSPPSIGLLLPMPVSLVMLGLFFSMAASPFMGIKTTRSMFEQFEICNNRGFSRPLKVVDVFRNSITAALFLLFMTEAYSQQVIYVDSKYCGPEDGSVAQPYSTIQAAHDAAFPGALISINAGFYPEHATLSKACKLVSANGMTIIGKGPIVLDGSLHECPDLMFIEDLPDPGWMWVDRNNPYRSVSGYCWDSFVNYTDFPESHDSHDHNTLVVVDPGQEGLLSNAAYDYADDPRVPDSIELEWEIGTFTNEGSPGAPERTFPH